MPRLFTGIFPPDDITHEMRSLRSGAGDQDVRWMPLENLHATLVFIGSVGPDEVENVREALSTVRFDAFSVAVRGVGAFPDPQRARVLWAGLEPPDPVRRLFEAVRAALEPVVRSGLARSNRSTRPYHPHITVARASAKERIDARHWIEKHAEFQGRTFRVDAFELVRSRTKPEGSEYTVIGRFGDGHRGRPE